MNYNPDNGGTTESYLEGNGDDPFDMVPRPVVAGSPSHAPQMAAGDNHPAAAPQFVPAQPQAPTLEQYVQQLHQQATQQKTFKEIYPYKFGGKDQEDPEIWLQECEDLIHRNGWASMSPNRGASRLFELF